jgi:hypothetical protein
MSLITISSYVASRTLYTVLSPELVINSVTSLSSSLLKGLYHLITITNDSELHKILITTDIIHDITIIKSFIEDLQKTNNKTITSSINNLNETLTTLDTTIESITKKFELHKTLWFSSYRSYNISSEKETLIFLSEQLKHRFNLLIKISSSLI